MSTEPDSSYPPPPSYGAPLSAGMAEKDIRLWSMLCHLSALAGLAIPSLGSVLGPLIVWLIKRNDHPTIDKQGRESLNFQISILIYTWVLVVIGIPTTFILVGFVFLGFSVLVGLAGLVGAIIGAIKTSNGESFRYPLTIRFL